MNEHFVGGVFTLYIAVEQNDDGDMMPTTRQRRTVLAVKPARERPYI